MTISREVSILKAPQRKLDLCQKAIESSQNERLTFSHRSAKGRKGRPATRHRSGGRRGRGWSQRSDCAEVVAHEVGRGLVVAADKIAVLHDVRLGGRRVDVLIPLRGPEGRVLHCRSLRRCWTVGRACPGFDKKTIN